MGSSTEIEQRLQDGLRDIASKWIRGRLSVNQLQGSGLVIVGNSAGQRALLILIDECSGELGALLDTLPNNYQQRIGVDGISAIISGLPADYQTAINEMYHAWSNRMAWKHRS